MSVAGGSVRATLCAAAALAAACQGGPGVGKQEQAIQGGEVIPGANAVGVCKLDVVLPPDSEGNDQDPIVCSCSVVAPDMVLTSARCVDENLDAGTLGDITVGFTADGSTQVGVASVELHRYFNPDDPNAFQLALVRLTGTAPVGETPVALNDAALDTSLEGQAATIVGFGETSDAAADFGQRLAVSTPVVAVGTENVTIGDAGARLCEGDSGAPAFADLGSGPVQIAIGRRLGRCDETVPWIRIDKHTADFLFPYIDQFNGPCKVDGVCETAGCRTPDPDCAGNECEWGNDCKEDCPTRDWDCPLGSFVGEDCARDGDCEQNGRCVAALDDDTFTYCTRPCETEEECPAGMTCDTGAGECIYEIPSRGSQGFACTLNEECRSGICEDQICVNECDPSANDCPAPPDGQQPYTCGPSKVADGKNVCLGIPLTGGGGFCSAGQGGGGAGGLALVLLALVAVRRRRSVS